MSEAKIYMYCKDCRRKLLSINWQNHLAVDSHLRNVNKNKEKVQCPICKRSILKLNINIQLNHKNL
jgi:Zn finger protein HypA/HybF involved in hydrogenase expression